jgi:serine/threonine-protein kinase
MSDLDPFRGTPYRVTRQLGAGGMGEVYEVEHEIVGRIMVAKVLRLELAQDAGTADRMRVEAQALAALSHPNIVNVTDLSRTADGRPFYVMERLEGCTLGEDFRRRRQYSVEEAIDVTRQILAGLEAAHQLGLVHRDIKMDNVFLQRATTGERVVKLLDFGVAKVLADRSARAPAPPSLPTADGAVVGTPRYLSPEQVLGRGVDHRADIYATGLVLYALVCGRGPFEHVEGQAGFLRAHLEDEPAAPSDVAGQPLPHELDAAILRAIRKSPADRFQSAADFAAALASIASRRARPIGWLETTPSEPPRPIDSSSIRESANAAMGVERGGHERGGHERVGHEAHVERVGHEVARNRNPASVLAGAASNDSVPTRTALVPASVGASVPAPVAASVPAPVGASVGASVPASLGASVAASVVRTPSRDGASPASAARAYVAAAVTAVAVALVGLVLSGGRSWLWLGVVFVAAIAVSTLLARIVASRQR